MTDDPGLERQVRRGLTWSMTNNISLRLGNLLVSVVVARLLAPDEFGVFMVGLSVVIVLQTFADLGMSAYLVRSHEADREAPTVMTVALVTSCTFGVLMAVLAGPLAAGFGTPDAEPILRWLSLSMALNGLGVIPGAAMQREFRQGQQYVVDFANLLVSSGVTVALAMGGAGAMSLVWARLSSQCVSLALQYYFSRSRFAFAWDMRRFRQIAQFGLPLAGANFLSWVLLSVGTVVVGREAGPVALGLYALAFNLSSWPTNAIGQSVRVVALPAFAQRRDAPPERTFLPAAAITWATALPVGLLLGVAAGPLITFLYGRTWAPAASALAGLACFGALRVLFDITVTFVVARGSSRPVLVVQILWLVALVPACVYAASRWQGGGVGWAHAVVALGLVLPAYLVVLARHGLRPGAVLRRLAPPVAAAVPATLVAWFVVQGPTSPFLAVVASGTSFVVVYVPLLLRWFRRELGALRAKGNDAAAEQLADPATGTQSTETLQTTQHSKATAHAAAAAGPISIDLTVTKGDL